jgi:hypothetical protein
MTAEVGPGGTTAIDDRLERRVADAAKRLYEAEVALHIAHQTRQDAWIFAASNKLHNAIAESIAAKHELDSRNAQACPPSANLLQ